MTEETYQATSSLVLSDLTPNSAKHTPTLTESLGFSTCALFWGQEGHNHVSKRRTKCTKTNLASKYGFPAQKPTKCLNIAVKGLSQKNSVRPEPVNCGYQYWNPRYLCSFTGILPNRTKPDELGRSSSVVQLHKKAAFLTSWERNHKTTLTRLLGSGRRNPKLAL